jgi:hypothetical protein
LDNLGRVLIIDLYGLSIFDALEGVGRGRHGRVGRRGWYPEAQLPLLGCSDCGNCQLDAVLLAIQRLLGLGLHGDDIGGSGYLELEVGIARDGHELHITWPP